MEIVITIIGAIASLIGAYWAWEQAKDAKSSANIAERIKDEIIDRRKVVEVSQVHTETSRILKIVSNVGSSSKLELLTGVDSAGIAKSVEEYSRFINEHSSYFTDLFQNRAKDLCEDLKSDIEKLADAQSPEEKKEAGKSIYYKIDSFMPVVKDLSDEKKENVAVNG